MNKLKTLVVMQLKDNLDFSVFKSKKGILRSTIFLLLKIGIITAFIYIALSLLTKLGVFFYSESPRVMILILTISLLLSLISCTVELMKSLYFSEDNRVLITFPIDANIIFISKIIVFYLHELKKSLSYLIPITFACALLLITNGCSSPLICLWILIPLLFIIALPVLLGALLSIPAMYISRFLKRFTIIEFLLALIILVSGVYLVITLIGLIPENIDLMNQWGTISKAIRSFLLGLEENLTVMSNLTRIVIGEQSSNLTYYFSWWTIVKFLILLLIEIVLFLGVYFASRPLFFSMMSKNFEINKDEVSERKNIRLNKYFTFINKEFKINLRTLDISVNYLMVYIIVPILILLLNSLYKAMDTKELGNILIYTFNILLMCLPMLASNSLVATYYSKEGRAAYIKKTKPIYVFFPLLAKMSFNALFSVPTIFVTVSIFGSSAGLSVGEIIILGFAILFLHLGHMVWSAMLDIMNPQNEQYATTGISFDNPNENKSTIIAFVVSFLYAVIAYKFISESSLDFGNMYMAFSKLCLISIAFLGSVSFLFTKRIKAYYYELQGGK